MYKLDEKIKIILDFIENILKEQKNMLIL